MIDVDCMQRCVLSNHLYILVACIYTTQRGLNVYVIIQKSLNKPSYGAVLRKCRLQEYISGLKEHSAEALLRTAELSPRFSKTEASLVCTDS